MERILVGVDGSDTALHALTWSADIARRSELELVVIRVFAPTQAELSPDRDRELHGEQREEVERWTADRSAGISKVRVLMVDGDPASELLEASRDEGADLLVTGGRGAGGFINLHLGSVTHHLVHHTVVPLAVVPETGSSPVRHLVLGVDGSSGSLAATERAAELAAALSVDVTVVYALEPYLVWVPANDERSWRHTAEVDARKWAAPLESAGVSFEIDVDRDTHPVAAISRAVEAREGSVAVVGARGLQGFEGLRLGRVPLQLVHHTGAAVIVVPSTAD